jgi:hypothetical protein
LVACPREYSFQLQSNILIQDSSLHFEVFNLSPSLNSPQFYFPLPNFKEDVHCFGKRSHNVCSDILGLTVFHQITLKQGAAPEELEKYGSSLLSAYNHQLTTVQSKEDRH